MAITRTPMVDDDGSGTTGTIINNAWKQEFYNQIDALGAGLPIQYGVWTPVDLSGAGLTLTNGGSSYARLGRLVFLWGHVQYPTTATAQPAVIGGFPVVNSSQFGGLYHTYGLATAYQIPTNQAYCLPLHPTTMASHTNAVLSAATLIFNGVYLVA